MASSPPQVSIISPTDGAQFHINEPITIVAEILDPDSTNLTYFLTLNRKLLETGKTTTGTFTRDIIIPQPGQYLIELSVLDEDSNYSVASIKINIVNTPPKITILKPEDNFITTATSIDLTVTASDKESSTLSLSIRGSNNFTYTASITSGTLLDIIIPIETGTNTIIASVSDGYTETSTSITVISKPVIVTFLYPKDKQYLPKGKIDIAVDVETRESATYTLLMNEDIIKTGTTSGETITASVVITETGTHTFSIIVTSGQYTASDSVTIYITEKPEIDLVFPKIITSGVATLTIVSNTYVTTATIFTDNIPIKTLSEIPTGTTTMSIQTQLEANTPTHTISLLINNTYLYSATFTATGTIPRIHSVGTPTTTSKPSITIDPITEGASLTLIYVNDILLGSPPQTFTPTVDGTYTIKVNAIGGNNFSVWLTQEVTFIWIPIINVKNAYWNENRLTIIIEITDYDKDATEIVIMPMNLLYPISMQQITETYTVEIPETYLEIGATLTLIAKDASGLTSSTTFTVPGKIPPPQIVAPNPNKETVIFEDSLQVTVEITSTGTIYWYQDGLLTKMQPAPEPGRYTYMFFTPDVKQYEIYARLCQNEACSSNSQILIIKRGAFVKLWIGRNMYFSNGQMKTMDVSPFIDPRYNRTVVPIRFVGEALGYQIGWNSQTRKVTLEREGIRITMDLNIKDTVTIKIAGKDETIYVGSATVTVERNGVPEIINLHTYNGENMGEPIIVNNRTYVPIRFLSEIIGAKVSWDDKTKSIGILLIP